MATTPSQKRLQKELLSLRTDPPSGLLVDDMDVDDDMSNWIIGLKCPADSLYHEERFKLSFKFNDNYPFEAPEVVFVGDSIPVHPHIYSNGHICLSILTDDWSPALSVQAVCLSILSMLTSCKEKKLPPDNSLYVRTSGKSPKSTKWLYHDDKV